jgi:hypothetical protein
MNHNGRIDAEDFKLLRSSMNGAWRKEHKYVNSTSRKDGKVIDYEVRYARKNNPSRKGYKGKTFANGGGINKDIEINDSKFERFKNDLIKYSESYKYGDGYNSRFKGLKNKSGDISTGEYLIEGNVILWNYLDKKNNIYTSSEVPEMIIDIRKTGFHLKERAYSTGGSIERKYNRMSKEDKEELMREKIGVGRTPFSEYEKYSQLSNYHKEMVDKHLSSKIMATGGSIGSEYVLIKSTGNYGMGTVSFLVSKKELNKIPFDTIQEKAEAFVNNIEDSFGETSYRFDKLITNPKEIKDYAKGYNHSNYQVVLSDDEENYPDGFYITKSKDYLKFKDGGGVSKFKMLSNKVARNYEGKRVKPQYQKEYGKVYSKEEAKEVGDKVAGKVKAMQKAESGASVKKGGQGGIMILAKKIRKEGESWKDALKRAGQQLK